MTLETERIAIETRFNDLWLNEDSPPTALTRVGFSSHGFKPTEDGDSVRLTIMNGRAETVSAGSPGANLVRNSGIIVIEIFSPGGKGEETIRPLAETVIGIFRNVDFGGIRCRAPYLVAQLEEPPFLIWKIVAPYERDEFNG